MGLLTSAQDDQRYPAKTSLEEFGSRKMAMVLVQEDTISHLLMDSYCKWIGGRINKVSNSDSYQIYIVLHCISPSL